MYLLCVCVWKCVSSIVVDGTTPIIICINFAFACNVSNKKQQPLVLTTKQHNTLNRSVRSHRVFLARACKVHVSRDQTLRRCATRIARIMARAGFLRPCAGCAAENCASVIAPKVQRLRLVPHLVEFRFEFFFACAYSLVSTATQCIYRSCVCLIRMHCAHCRAHSCVQCAARWKLLRLLAISPKPARPGSGQAATRVPKRL